MKNKKNIYILLPVVLFIWGAVFIQFFSFSGIDQKPLLISSDYKIKPLQLREKDSFSINVNYRDPFLGKVYFSDSIPKKSASKIKKVSKIEEPLVWPSILYKGIVSDTKDKIKIFMLIVDGKTCLMKKGETENELFLKDGDRESIYIKYKGNLNLIMAAE